MIDFVDSTQTSEPSTREYNLSAEAQHGLLVLAGLADILSVATGGIGLDLDPSDPAKMLEAARFVAFLQDAIAKVGRELCTKHPELAEALTTAMFDWASTQECGCASCAAG